MITRQAQRFAKAGYGVLILDLYGTGDSAGSFDEATLHIWQQDILAAIAWLNKTSEKPKSPPVFWAMRSGALIAADLVQQYPDITDQMILWSPVSNGKKFINQFMRIKLAAGMTTGADSGARTLKDLWAHLETNQCLEIAGYNLSSALAQDFTNLSLSQIKLPHTISVKWIEISLGDPPTLSPASQNIINIWKEHKVQITETTVNDATFWTLQEPEWANCYIDQTLRLLEK